ncbi:phosphate starvation-inducible protein PsiF [Bosea minatitlanensis]|uniref:Phosphate starvation-inducible protein PsiF n=1 Tax=Bosea minatitlanensis TaxID=128782 RepID=A0ABW0EZY3_9HYPH|nr:phosphate starvation-inducible protein PsiF [Bosea minatitlanensis]MCT4492258.1 phosphate starvation-inducible protein PsiF [Bosea minatitlanensis]
MNLAMNLAGSLLPLAALARMTGHGFAQSPAVPAPAAAKPAVAAPAQNQAGAGEKTAIGAADKAARSKDCSAQADRKGLRGKARKRFRDDCKRH